MGFSIPRTPFPLWFLLFSTVWGICFSFKGSPNGLNLAHKCTVCARSPSCVRELIGDICAFSAAAKPRFRIRKPDVAFCDPKAHARVGLEWKALFLTPPLGVEHACHTQETSETPVVPPDGRSAGEGPGRTARVYVCEESHCDIVPMNHSNKDGASSAESEEGRLQLKENAFSSDPYPTQRGTARVPGVGECADKRHVRPLFICEKNRMR